MKNQNNLKIAQIAILAALSTVLYFTVKFPLPFIFPSFLDVQFSNLPAIIGGFVFGPIAGSAIILIRTIIKLPFSSTMFVGELADLLIGLATVLTSSIIYRKMHSKKGAVIALISGSFAWIVISTLANYFILVPFYIEFYFGGNVAPFIGFLSMIPGVDETNYMSKYIVYTVIPFNLMLSTLVSVITFLVYKRISILFKTYEEVPIPKKLKQKTLEPKV